MSENKSQRDLSNILDIASKEFSDNITSKRFILIGIFYIGAALLLAGLAIVVFYLTMSAYNSSTDEMQKMTAEMIINDFRPDIVLSYMNILNIILALLAIIVSCDSISLERKDRTIYQLLSKPVERSSVVLGKFLGNLGVVSVLFVTGATIAYILTAVATGKYPSVDHLPAIAMAILFMVILLAVYVAVGMLISTVTRNPFISIIGSLIIWMGFWFLSTIGNMIGQTIVYNEHQFIIGTASDIFNYYPVYAKVLVWLDPLSHGVMPQILSGMPDQVAAGLPVWANIIVLLLYTCVALLASVLVFERQDL